jgi:cyclase
MQIGRPRVAASLLIDQFSLVKSVEYNRVVYCGDPVNAVKIYSQLGFDELIVCWPGAGSEKWHKVVEFLTHLSAQSFLPMTYGGGIRSAKHAVDILRAGFERVVVGAMALRDTTELKRLADVTGSQSLVANLDYVEDEGIRILRGPVGDAAKDRSFEDCLYEFATLPIGDVILNAVSRDGRRVGHDIDAAIIAAQICQASVTVSCGARDVSCVKQAIDRGFNSVASSLYTLYGETDQVLLSGPEVRG